MFRIITAIAILLATALITNASPLTAAALVGEDKPWQIYNLSINALPVNTTKTNQTQHITFIAVDENVDGGLNFTTTCSRFLPAGQSLFSNGYTPCNFTDAGFSLRPEGTLFFHRKYKNGEKPPFDSTVCNGSGDLKKAKYYSNGPSGMSVVEDHMEIACTQMS